MRIIDYTILRKYMVQEQLRARGIHDKRVLEVFERVERHKFVPPEYVDVAYEDHPLPIGEGQTISQPYMVALMTECLQLKGDEKVLEIGTGSGYQAAILSLLAKEVYTIERIESLANKAEQLLLAVGYTNVHVLVGDGTEGAPEYAPYEGIIVTAAAPSIPPPLIEQLTEGGRIVIPMGSMYSQVLVVATKHEKRIEEKEVCACVFVPLLGKYGWQEDQIRSEDSFY